MQEIADFSVESVEFQAVGVLIGMAVDRLYDVEEVIDGIVPVGGSQEEDVEVLDKAYAMAVQAGLDNRGITAIADALSECVRWMDGEPTAWPAVAREVLGI